MFGIEIPLTEQVLVGVFFWCIAWFLHKQIDTIMFWYSGSVYQKWDNNLMDNGKQPFWKLNSRKENNIPIFRDGWHLLKWIMWASIFLAIGVWDLVVAGAMCAFAYIIWEIS